MSNLSRDDEECIHILDLPNEVLHKILSYVPNQFTVGEVCKRFYEISCRFKSFKLTLGDFDDIYESILQSSRQIKSLVIETYDDDSYSMIEWTNLNLDRLEKIIERIGENVTELFIASGFPSIGLTQLNLMPNLRRISLEDIECSIEKFQQDFKFQLHNLKELEITNSREEIIELFNRLPDDVLNKLALCDIKPSRGSVKHFGNQRNLKHVITFHSDEILDKLDLGQTKLLSMLTSSLRGLKDALTGQDQMISLNADSHNFEDFDQDLMNFICAELKSLIYLVLTVSYSYIDLSKIQDLKNLVHLKIASVSDESLKTLKSRSLKFLELQDFNEEALTSGSVECPNLVAFKSLNYDDYNGGFNIENFLLHFPKVVSFTYNSKSLTFSEGWENHSLKYVRQREYAADTNTIGFLKRCKRLLIFSMENYAGENILERLLIEVPSLKFLCFFGSITQDHPETIKNYGKHLDYIHLRLNSNKFQQNIAKWKNVLGDQFPVFEVKSESYPTEVLLHKNVKVVRCCELLEDQEKLRIRETGSWECHWDHDHDDDRSDSD